MKKYFLISLLLVTAAISAAAGNVDYATARKIASNIFSTTRSNGVSLVWDGTDGTRGTEPLFYVFNYDGGGFVVISADDRAYPVLGYSEKGSFRKEGMPMQIRSWFDGYGKQIEYIRSADTPQSGKIAERWKNITTPSVIKDLHTPLWDQEYPYNSKIPGGELTGCVATATAAIMYHHKWPKTTSGEALPSYKYFNGESTVTYPGHNLATSYDWDSMLYEYGESVRKQSADAVGTLMYDLGVALQLAFGKEGTSGYSEDIPPILVHYFNYDSSAMMLYRDAYTAREWEARMKAEIDADRPVAYGAEDKIMDAGHQFILDGYGTDGFFKFNFGWSGYGNALYRMEAIDVPDSSDDSYKFNYGQTAAVNIQPNRGSQSGDREKKIEFVVTEDYRGGLSLIEGSIAKGNTPKIAVWNVCNNNSSGIEDIDMGSVTADYALCLMDRSNNIKQIFGETGAFTLESGYFFSDTVKCHITCDLNLGDKFVYCYKTSGQWVPVRCDYSLYNYPIDNVIINTLDELAAFDFPAIKIDPAGYKAGDVLDLRLENCHYIPTIVWTVDGKRLGNGINCVRLTAGKHTIQAEATFYKSSTKGTSIRTDTLVRVVNVN